MRELLTGGQKSGKSAQAEKLAQDWLASSPAHTVVLVATAQGLDAEMCSRIARHQADRAQRFGDDIHRAVTVEEPLDLASCISQYSDQKTLVVVDCLTLWLTNHLMPADSAHHADGVSRYVLQETKFLNALRTSAGRVVLVSNEIGLGVIPMGAQVRHFVDTLGVLNQRVAQVCDRVTMMAAGLPLTLKGAV